MQGKEGDSEYVLRAPASVYMVVFDIYDILAENYNLGKRFTAYNAFPGCTFKRIPTIFI